MSATFVYGLIEADTNLPEGLTGLGPSKRVSTITYRNLAAVVSDLPLDRPLGTRDDLMAHENVVDTIARTGAVVPMRFPAVVEESGVVEELLEPHHDELLEVLAGLVNRAQFTLKGRYVQEVVLREVVEADEEIRELRERVRDLPEDATYYDRVRLGELIVAELEKRREIDVNAMLDRLEPFVLDLVDHQPTNPEDVIHAAFLVDRDEQAAFENAVDELGKDWGERVRLRLLGPLAPYDFVPEG